MKVGEKYVIEIDKVFVTTFTSAGLKAPTLAKIKGFNSLVFDENGLSKLEKLEDVIQEECDRARQEGLNDGRKIGCREYHDGCVGCEYELFDGDPCTTCKGSYVDKYKPKVEKTVGIRKYDICKFNDETEEGFEFCVTNVRYYADDWYFDAIRKDGSVMLEECLSEIVRVGHIDSLDEWLKEIQ